MDDSRGGSAIWAHPDRKNSSRSLPEVSVSNAERIGKRPSDLAVSNRLQISATSSSSRPRRSANEWPCVRIAGPTSGPNIYASSLSSAR